MTIDFGISFRWIASSLVMIRLRSISMPGHAARLRAGRDDDLLARGERLLLPLGDLDLALAGQPSAALDPVDLVLLEQQLDAAGEALDDLVLAGVHLGHVDADGGLADRQAPLLPVLRDLQRVRVLEQRLGRNAAPVQAGAAEHRRALDDRGLQAELRGADRGHVAAGARADHYDVVFVGHLLSFFLMDDSGTKDTDGVARRRDGARPRACRGLSGSSRPPGTAAACSRSAAPSTDWFSASSCARQAPAESERDERDRAGQGLATTQRP